MVIYLNLDKKFPEIDDKKLMRIVKIGFSSKRKQLQNNLSAGLKISRDEVKKILVDLGLDEKIRAQDLSVENWVKLSNNIKLQ